MWSCAISALLLVQLSAAYFFEDGFNHHYTYSVDSNIFGVKNITTVLKFHIRAVNTTIVGHRLHFLEVDSIVQFTADGLFRDNPKNWDLTKHFLFETATDGSISLVHVHPEDRKELLIIKKALASLFSVKVQLSEDNEWTYNTTENDHYGVMKHEYVATKTTTGMTLKRRHHSTDRGHRQHEKVLHYNHRGTVHTATSHDIVILKETQPYYTERRPNPGEYIHRIHTSGEFPDIYATAQVNVKLDSKRHHGNEMTLIDGLTPGMLHTKEEKDKNRLVDVSLDIERNMECIHNISDVTDANRSACVENLRANLLSLDDSDYRHHVEQILSKTCDPHDVMCRERRLVYIDLVARAGDMTSQEVIQKEVLDVPDPVLDEIRRVFVHCIVIKHPSQKFVHAIERFCFGEENSLHGSTSLTVTQRRACLALGSLAKHIAQEHQVEAQRLMKNIETWIHKHKQVNKDIRVKRAVPLTELNSEEDEYILARSTLIHSLGNAALQQSLPHILSHTHPNPAHHVWKRAAVTALRHYTCPESAVALFEIAMYDRDKTVRKVALEQYKQHPRSKEFTSAHRDVMLGHGYTYPSLLRFRRNALDRMLNKILLEFELKTPTYDWKKVIGSTKIGASFGVKFENSMRALFRPLSGFVDVNIDDQLFAEAHVGMLNLHFDILLVEACYKGRLEYNMNIFKDFSVNLAKDIASAFDQLTDTMMKPMVDAANHMATQFQDGETSARKHLFEPLASATRDIPTLTGNALEAALNLTRTADQFTGLPWMTKFKEVVGGAQSLVEDIHSDAMDFYHKIADAAMTSLPFAEKEIRDAANNALKVMGQVSQAPQQSFRALEETRLKYQLGVARMIKSNSIIREATSLIKGDRSSWMSAGGEIGDLIAMLRSSLTKLQQQSRKRRSDGFLAGFNAGVQEHLVDTGLNLVQEAVVNLIGHLSHLQHEAPKNFQQASDMRQLAAETLQAGFVAFKEAVEKVKSTIHALFGQKFYESFPSQRKGCDKECGCGYYPTDPHKKYLTPGIDLIWKSDHNWTIPCPVGAMVIRGDDPNTLILRPVSQDLNGYEIIISNIIPNIPDPVNVTDPAAGSFVKVGQNIGISAGDNGCSDDHIHVSIRKYGTQSGCFYLDPSPFLDSVKIMPKWTEKCKYYHFRHIGQMFEHGSLTKGFKNVLKTLKRQALKYASGLVMKDILDSGIIPDSIMSSVQSFVSMYQDVVQDATNLGQLFTNVGNHMQQFFGKINVGGISFNNAIHMLDQSGVLRNKFPALQAVVSKVDKVLNTPPAQLLKDCSSGLVGKLMTKLHLPKLGGKSSAVALIKASASKLCPSFKNGVARGFGHACSAQDDCMGLVCEIKIPFIFKTSTYKIGFQVYPQESKTVLFAGKRVITINGTRTKEIVSPGIRIMGFKVKLKLSITYSHPAVNISAVAIVCGKQKCLPPIPIVKELRFGERFNTGQLTTSSRVSQSTSSRTHPTSVTTRLSRDTGSSTRSTVTSDTHSTTTPTFSGHKTTHTARQTSHRTTLHLTGKQTAITSTSNVFDKTSKRRVSVVTPTTRTTQRYHSPTHRHWKVSTRTTQRYHSPTHRHWKVSTRTPTYHNSRTTQQTTRKPRGRSTKRPSRRQRKRQSRLRSLGKRSMAKMSKLVSNLNQKAQVLVDHMNSMRQSIKSKLGNVRPKGFAKFSTELKNPHFKVDSGAYPNPGQSSEVNIEFLDFIAAFPVGPFMFTIRFTAGGALGTSFDVHVDSVQSEIKAQFTPWVAGRMEADMSVSVIIAKGGINLVGYIMKTKFPLTLEVKYAKLPVKQIKALDVELIPLELKLTAYVKILFFINIHTTLWHWRADALRHRIFEKVKTKNDDSPPRFPSCSAIYSEQEDTPSVASDTCIVKQLKGRHHVDTAFSLEVSAVDDSSDLVVHYSVGRHPGGQDVKDWTQIRGPSQMVPASLPNGIPLYWTVRVKNSQGLTSNAHCKLETYDNTLPDGRVQESYPYTSHPNKIGATVVVFEDSPLLTVHNISLGYSPGQYGREVRDDEPFQLEVTRVRSDISNELKYFSPPREGKMTVAPFYSTTTENDVICAQKCISHDSKCVSFDFELHTQICDLHDVIEGPKSKLRISGSYQNYERLGIGYSAYKEYSVDLEHGARYYINAHLYNTLGYHSYLLSRGTLVDFTPPQPGPIVNSTTDVTVNDGCHAAVSQRCSEVTWNTNHRKIIDGPGSKTVFNGNKPLQDTLFSMANNYISANWDGFHDDESGIWGYTWAAGTFVCGSDVAPFVDPFSNLASPAFWTYSGFAKDIVLPDGQYYVTTQAINSVVHGGALVTTVCHSTPITIDTTPPLFHQVSDLLFDEDFDMMAVYYNVSDPGSGIARVDFGLGKTKYDVKVRSYSHHEFMDRASPYLVIEDLRLEPGVQAWVRLRAVNKVGLVTASHGNQPILIDRTAPIAGRVYDGDQLKVDSVYQSDSHQICAQWLDFFDPESGIASYLWGVGTSPTRDDVVQYKTYPSDVKSGCCSATLQHNTSYFSTIIAYNRALNQKNITAVSSGVLIDETAPVPGWLHDGDDELEDMDYSSETATVQSVWDDFSDPESGIADYSIKVYVNENLRGTFDVGTKTSFTDHSVATKHGDKVRVELVAENGAGLKTFKQTDGYILDETAPDLVYFDGLEHVMYQSDNTSLKFKWEFADSESNLKEYRYKVFMEQGTATQNFIPSDDTHMTLDMSAPSTTEKDLNFTSLSLETGARYFILVTAVNNAMMSTMVKSPGVIIDITGPVVTDVIIAMPDEEEELDDDGKVVEHAQGEDMYVSWSTFDPESSISQSSICLSLKDDQCSKDTDFTSVGMDISTKINGALLNETSQYQYYSVFVKVTNGAKLTTIAQSKKIKVIKGDVPGVVFDGRSMYEDENFQRDKSSIAISFSGFESEACGISGYEWGVGTHPFYTDIISYTDYGLVVTNSTSGFAQIHNMNFEGVKYFVSVRAKTGDGCPRDYVVSSSNGIVVDNIPPVISFSYQDSQSLDDNHYSLVNLSSYGILWKATDNVDIARYEWASGSIDSARDTFVTLNQIDDSLNRGSVSSGETRFLTIRAADKAGNIAELSSAPVTYDSTKPIINNLICSTVISQVKPNVRCSWDTLGDVESTLYQLQLAVGTEPLLSDILPPQNVSTVHRSWNRDMGYVIQKSIDKLYITITILNGVKLQTDVYREVIIDISPPKIGKVRVVTTTDIKKNYHTQKCQIPTSYIDIAVEGFQDKESGIDRYEAAVGSMEGGANIKDYVRVDIVEGFASLQYLHLVEGTIVFVTLRVYNKAGLYILTSSGAVAISPDPYVTVTDGSLSTDQDIQTDLSMIQGHWSYSQPCPIIKVDWAIEDIAGNIVKLFEPVPDNGFVFYNDELQLENKITYINVIRVVDAMNRTHVGHSDGISVQIQSPNPGFVNDGLGEDINFQHSDSTLYANWRGFGHNNTSDPSQMIDHYEVAIGNDRRYLDTRVNVMNFQNVGFNLSATFDNLKLTKKTETYYITVRAYSIAGSFQEAYSNGVKVGYTGEFKAGTIETAPAQSSIDHLGTSWSGVYSDIGIREYHVGLTLDPEQTVGKPFLCKEIDKMNISANVYGFVNVGLDQVHMFTGLSLSHGSSYVVLLITYDESGMCLMMQGYPIIVDTTPPTAGEVKIHGEVNKKVMYSNSQNQLSVYIDGFEDLESDIAFYDVTLDEGRECTHQDTLKKSTNLQIAKQRLTRDDITVFNSILLKMNNVYYISVDAYNQAGLKTSVLSKEIKVDETPPSSGTVHSGSNWKQPMRFQRDTNVIRATLAISHDEHSIVCENYMSPSEFQILDNMEFSKECVEQDSDQIRLLLHHDASLKRIKKGAVSFKKIELKGGNYTVRVKPAFGTNILTGVSYTSQDNYIRPEEFVDVLFANVTHCTENSSFCTTNETHPFINYGYNFGVLVYPRNNTDSKGLGTMWVQDRFKLQYYTVHLDPKIDGHQLIFMLQNKTVLAMPSWDITFFINGEQAAVFSGLALDFDIALDIFTWNNHHYIHPVVDPFHPFKTEAVITNIKVPKHQKPTCIYGSPFVDQDSGLKEIWIGLSDTKNNTANVVPFQLYSSFCNQCDKSCEPDCQYECHLPRGLIVMTLELQNTSLVSASEYTRDNQTGINTSTDFSNFRLPTYFVDIKVKNYAGLVTYSKSDAVLVDTSPPHIEYVKCIDPDYSSDESIEYLGNNHSISVKWEAGEDVSGIVSTFVSIGTAPGRQDIHPRVFVSANKALTIDGLGGKLLHRQTYYVNVEVENGAGERSVESCNFTMDILPPDTENVSASSMFSQPINISSEAVEITHYTDKVGMQWNSDSVIGAQYYEWKIGTTSDGHDIFPLMRIGKKQAKRIGIVAGKMRLDGIQTNPDLAEFFERNMTNIKSVKHQKKKGHFRLEPGRCIYQSLYAVSRSHLHSKISSHPLCIKRKKDKLNKFGGNRLIVSANGEVSDERSAKMSQKAELALDLEVAVGGLSVGVLDETDVQSVYGSTASANYRPYIADPHLTSDRLSRYLKQRLLSTTKPMFYIAPVPTVKLKNKIKVTKPFDKKALRKGSEIALLYWDSGDQLWRSVQEACGLGIEVNLTTTLFENEVCENIFRNTRITFVKASRDKRSVERASTPRHFIIAIIGTGLHNSVPTIKTTKINGEEDSILEAKIDFSDADGDNLTFTIKMQPLHGSANITRDGFLHYMPEPDFTGVDQLEIAAVEVIDAPAITPHELSAVIRITVQNVNDAPTLFFENSSNSLINSEDIDTVDIELTNKQTKHLVGTFWLADVDRDDSLSYHKIFPEQPSSLNFSLVPQAPADEDDTPGLLASLFGTISRQQLWLYHLPNYTGSTNVSFIIVDHDNAFSRPIKIHVRVKPHSVDGLSAVIIAVIVVSGLIVLAVIAAISFRYYMNSKNKIRDIGLLPDNVADSSHRQMYFNALDDLELQALFQHRFIKGNPMKSAERFADTAWPSPSVTTSDVRAEVKVNRDHDQLTKVDI